MKLEPQDILPQTEKSGPNWLCYEFARIIPEGRVLSVAKTGSIRIWPVDAAEGSHAA
jgi:hypothetical protein